MVTPSVLANTQLWNTLVQRELPTASQQTYQPLGGSQHFHTQLEALAAALPSAWLEAAEQAAAANIQWRDLEQDAHKVMVDALMWPDPSAHAHTHSEGRISAASATVKQATDLQLDDVRAARQQLHEDYVLEAYHHADINVQTACMQLDRALRSAWSLQWENCFKETLWRMTVDGVRHPYNAVMAAHTPMPLTPTPQDTTADTAPQPAQRVYMCHCGTGMCGRAHHFHECPVAQGVYEAIQHNTPGQQPIGRSNIWLPHSPHPHVDDRVWLVVCLAALSAMETGRKRLASLHYQHHHALPPSASQTLITDFFAPLNQQTLPPRMTPVEIARRHAVMQFWANLHNFAAKGVHGNSMRWVSNLNAAHPFLAYSNGIILVHGGP